MQEAKFERKAIEIDETKYSLLSHFQILCNNAIFVFSEGGITPEHNLTIGAA